MKENNSKTIAFKQREEHHISKYKFKANEYGKIDFKVIPYPKYKKVLRNGRKFIKFKNIFIILLIILISSAYFFLTNKRLSHLIDKKESNSISVSDDRTISNIDFNTYSKIIESHINTLIPLITNIVSKLKQCIKTVHTYMLKVLYHQVKMIIYILI